ncbi:MAG: polysaccharide biosynthesis tyrosine autokinase [Burkholderiales bacterium]
MNSQVYPLPNRAESEDVALRSEPEFHVTVHDKPRPVSQTLVDIGRLSADDTRLIQDYQARTGASFADAGISLGLLDVTDLRAVHAAEFGQVLLSPDSGIADELIAARDPDAPAVEHLRSLRTQLTLRWFEGHERQSALAIVSPGSGEGRSWITANLAVLFAQTGKRTLLIDADLRRPRQHALFGISSSQNGLSAILSGRAGLDTLVTIPGIPDLTLLPAGVVPPNPTELLSRPLFQRLLNALRARYEIILLDTPAASSGGDADTIAARAGGALVVACRDVSSVPALTSLCENLGNFGVTVTGAVLNGAPAHGRRH